MNVEMQRPFKWTDAIIAKLSSCQAGRALILNELGVPASTIAKDPAEHSLLYKDGSALVFQGTECVLVISGLHAQAS